MFKNILFATDNSQVCEIAAKTAFELSRKYGSILTLLYVDKPFSRRACPFVPDTAAEENRLSDVEYIVMGIEGMKKHYASLIKKDGLTEYCIVEGNPAAEILKFAQKNKVDCIIMGGHTQTDEPGGKTLEKVAQKAGCPVMSITRSCETSFWYFNRIIFGTDFSKASMSAFQFAYQLAVYIGCRLHIFHALEIGSCRGPAACPDQKQIEDQLEAAKKRISALYVAQMEDFDNYDITVWEGIPYIELLKFSREKSADLIVMAHHTKESHPQNVSFGPTIEQVLLRSACPVINVNQHCRF